MTPTSRRPYFLDLFRIRFPVGAVCSIGHRAAGVILAVALPALVYLLDRSLAGPQQYAAVVAWLRSVPGKALVVLLAWAFGHHVLAGVRHMLKDVDVGSSLAMARRSAWLALAGGGVIALAAVMLVLRA
ncbi:MAG TPA: succinate dehydrogenase, cytochrome b556 subunit [Casimicrobiaceae bacterium]